MVEIIFIILVIAFSEAHGIIWVIGHKVSLNEFKNIEIKTVSSKWDDIWNNNRENWKIHKYMEIKYTLKHCQRTNYSGMTSAWY